MTEEIVSWHCTEKVIYTVHIEAKNQIKHEQSLYSTLFKTQERESDRRSKEIEQRKETQKTHTNKTRTCDPKY